MRRLALTVALVLLAACEKPYVYAPTVNTSATVAGRPASYYSIPKDAPSGDVRLASFGIADIGLQGSDKEVHAIHMRMIVANNSAVPWTVDTREQRLTLPGQGESRAAYATSDQGAPPIVEIPPGQARRIDLFYPLPANRQDAGDLPAFDTVWAVHAGDRVVVERTPFERLEVHYPAYDDAYYYGYYGWGPPYYYDPYYPSGAWVGVTVGPGYRAYPPTHIHTAPPAPPAHAPPATRVR